FLFLFYDTSHSFIYPLSLHDALPIYVSKLSPIADAGQKLTGHNPADARHTHHILDTLGQFRIVLAEAADLDATKTVCGERKSSLDRKSTRLNSSHVAISYAVFCLKKK